jgi:hypothetical protein
VRISILSTDVLSAVEIGVEIAAKSVESIETVRLTIGRAVSASNGKNSFQMGFCL